jgi:hypothetical protein
MMRAASYRFTFLVLLKITLLQVATLRGLAGPTLAIVWKKETEDQMRGTAD